MYLLPLLASQDFLIVSMLFMLHVTGLITEEPKPWANFPDAAKALDTISISSEAESVDDVWSITEEQREYYIQQFQKMQTDLSNVISGKLASLLI